MGRGWEVRWEDESEDSKTAVICEYEGRSRYYDIAEISNVPCELDEEGNPTAIRREGENQRLREVLLMVCAPDMFKAMQAAVSELEKFTGLNAKFDQSKWPDVEVVWKHIRDIQFQLERVIDDVQDVDRI